MAVGMTYSMEQAIEMMSARELFGFELIKMAEEGKEFALVLSEESVSKTVLGKFSQKFPERVVDVGIAETNGVGVAAGLALSGKVTFFSCFGPFLSLRCVDQIHTDLAYNDLPVRLIGTHGGLTSGGGPTHYTILDIAIMRVIPNMTMVVPADAHQCTKLIRASMDYPGPMYIRLARGDEPLVYENQEYEYVIGKAITAKEGSDLTVIACGVCVAYAVMAATRLEKEGISVRVIDMHTIKPLDTEVILDAARQTGGIITAEDHNIVGGLGDAVASTLACAGLGVKLKKLGVPDIFASVGYPEALYAHYGYDADGIYKEIKAMLEK